MLNSNQERATVPTQQGYAIALKQPSYAALPVSTMVPQIIRYLAQCEQFGLGMTAHGNCLATYRFKQLGDMKSKLPRLLRTCRVHDLFERLKLAQ